MLKSLRKSADLFEEDRWKGCQILQSYTKIIKEKIPQLISEYLRPRRFKFTLIMCILMFVLGIPMITEVT